MGEVAWRVFEPLRIAPAFCSDVLSLSLSPAESRLGRARDLRRTRRKVPRPGFPLYQVIAESHGASVLHYDLLPEKGWEVDLGHVESLVVYARDHSDSTEDGEGRGGDVGGIVVNNPGNPTGAVYRRGHLEDVADVAARLRVTIVADEVYGDMVFGGRTFHPMADVAAGLGRRVPVITASGLGKQCECLVKT